MIEKYNDYSRGIGLIEATFLLVLILCLNINSLFAQNDNDPITCGNYRKIHSQVLGEDRTLLINLPRGYDKQNRTFPVIFKLDGEKDVFLQTFSAANYLFDMTGKTPGFIIVGIKNQDRAKDMFPDRGADKFISFLETELIPFIEKEYKSNGFRILAGQSLSAVFAYYSFLKKPELFSGYILASFSLFNKETEIIFKNELIQNEELKTLGKKYIFIGDARIDSYDPDGTRTQRGVRFTDSLKLVVPQTVLVKRVVYEDEGHVPFPAIYDGLKWIYSFSIQSEAQISASSKLQIRTSRLDSLDRLMEDKVLSNSLAGIEYILANKSEIIHHKTVGYRDIEKQDTLQENSLYRIYCTAHPIKVVAALMLVDRGLLSLDDPLSKYIPEFKNMKVLSKDSIGKFIPAKREITIYDLLTAQSGIGYIKEYYKNIGFYADSTSLKEGILKLPNLPLTHQPGEGFQYGISLNVLSFLVELITKVPFAEFVRQNLFIPLEMYDTDYFVSQDKIGRFVSMYDYDQKAKNLKLWENAENSKFVKQNLSFTVNPHLVSTPMDYLKFAQMLLNEGTYKNKKFISPKYIDLMITNHLPDNLLGTDPNIRKRGWGMGGWVEKDGRYGKEGGDDITTFWIDKKNDLTGIIFHQTCGNYSIFQNIINAVYDKK